MRCRDISIEFKLAQEKHLNDISQIDKAVHTYEDEDFLSCDVGWSKSDFVRAIRDHNVLQVVEEGCDSRSFISGYILYRPTTDAVIVSRLAVDPAIASLRYNAEAIERDMIEWLIREKSVDRNLIVLIPEHSPNFYWCEYLKEAGFQSRIISDGIIEFTFLKTGE